MVVDRRALVTAVVVDIGPPWPSVVDLCAFPIVIGINTLRFLTIRSLNTSVTTTKYETFKISQLFEKIMPLGITRFPTLEPGSWIELVSVVKLRVDTIHSRVKLDPSEFLKW